MTNFDFNDMLDLNPADPVGESLPPSIFHSNLLTKSMNEIPMCDLGSLKLIKFKCEATEDYVAGSTFSLCKVPPSEIRILGALSNMTFDITGNLGWTKYRTRRQEVIDKNQFGFNCLVDTDGLQTIKVDSLEGMFMIYTTDEPGRKGDIIEGYIVYVKL